MINPEYTQETVNIWFPIQREPLYDPDDPEMMAIWSAYWHKEKDRLINGFYIEEVYISGWLYWHTVYWKIAMYVDVQVGPNMKKVRKVRTPIFREIEWLISDDFNKCEAQGLFYILVGCRGFGKSIIAASRAGWLYTFFEKSESIISGAEKGYIKLTTDKIEDGLTNLHPVFKKQRISNNWDKEIRAGWKDKQSNQPHPKSSNSTILIRNFKMGNDSMACNGTRPGFHLIDEIGTLPNFIGCIKDSEPAWWADGKLKPSCLAMYAGTGGDMEKGAEAAEVFFAPDAHNILSFEDTWEGRGRIGRFIPATLANKDFFEKKTLAEYLNIQSEALSNITILVADEVRAKREWWDDAYKTARKSGNQKALLKFQAYWPIKPSQSFLVLNKNDFNTEAAKKQQADLKAIGGTVGTPVELYHDGKKICHSISEKLPLTQFPVKDQNPDAPVMIYEFPIDTVPPFGLYVAGVDPYRQGKAVSSSSLGAVYIFKRIHNILTEKYQYMFVASYVARPADKGDWENQARLLIKYYNALALVENDELSFIDYMVKMGDEMYLQPQPQWLKGIDPNSKVQRDFGIHMSNPRIRSHVFDQLKKHLDEIINRETDITGSVISERLGVTTVKDIMLLEEIIKFNFDDNFDRVIAASLAVTLANHLDPLYKVGSTDSDKRLVAYFDRNKRVSNSTLPSQGRVFKNGKIRMFS